jgi:hypothetical protein
VKIVAAQIKRFCFSYFLFLTSLASAQSILVNVDSAWANNSVNTVIFRKNSIVSFGDSQYVSFYNQQRHVVLGKRKLGTEKWQLVTTPYQGNVADAHNSISIMVDGEGYLHVAWDHHNNALRYAKSVSPGSLVLTEKMSMTNRNEESVSYPEFFKLNNTKLLFFYRDGKSGQGNLVINDYDISTKKWTQLHSNLLNGEGKRNAYWQACVDNKGTVHLSWTWRESPDVASNHDIAYARSKDGGRTWEKSNGEIYNLPITQATAEYAIKIPENSELINQTSMSCSEDGVPVIASYWREQNSNVPQYHLIYHNEDGWKSINLNFRKTPFSLSGVGTRQIPISRPQILVKGSANKISAVLIFRDEERANRPSAVIIKNLLKRNWKITDLSNIDIGSWEPTYDTELWKEKRSIHLFIQKVVQVTGEGTADIAPQMVQILEWKPKL